jgi:hypothetical protein
MTNHAVTGGRTALAVTCTREGSWVDHGSSEELKVEYGL